MRSAKANSSFKVQTTADAQFDRFPGCGDVTLTGSLNGLLFPNVRVTDFVCRGDECQKHMEDASKLATTCSTVFTKLYTFACYEAVLKQCRDTAGCICAQSFKLKAAGVEKL